MRVSQGAWTLKKSRPSSEPPDPAKQARIPPPEQAKRAAPAAPRPREERRCSWRFGSLDNDYPKRGGWNSVKGGDLLRIVSTLGHCDRTPWLTVKSAPSKQAGGMVTYDATGVQDNFAKKAKRRLRQLDKGVGWDRITRVRLGGKK